jgi:HAD superfamily hydrolase (TIGR01509 family)
MNFQAILFDMDGVVINTEAAVIAFWEKIAAQYGVKITPADYDTHVFGRPCAQSLDVLFPHLTAAERADVFAVEQDFEINQVYTATPGVIGFLRALDEANIPRALVTSGEMWKVDEVMRQLGIRDLFTTMVTAEDTPQGKPDPTCYRLGAQRLNVPPEDCLVFEDSVSGVQAALGAGAYCVGVRPARTAPTLIALGVTTVIPDFTVVRLDNGILTVGSNERFEGFRAG